MPLRFGRLVLLSSTGARSTDPWRAYKCSRSWCTTVLKWPGSSLFLADAGIPVGFLLLHPKGFLGSPYIAAVVIAEAFRGRGIGGEMLRFAETIFEQERHIYLCVSSFNSRAFALCQRHAFARVGELPDFICRWILRVADVQTFTLTLSLRFFCVLGASALKPP